MAWAFRAAGAVSTGASPTPALPTGWQVNDLLLIIATSGATFSTAPTGYTQIALHSASPFLTIWWKLAVTGETAKQVVNTNTATAAVVLAYSGANVFDVVSTVATASSTTLATNTATTTAANDLVYLGAKTLTLSNANNTFAGVIADAGGITSATGGGLTLSAGTETLTNANTVTPSFTPVLAGSYSFRLVVNDGKDLSAPAVVTIQVGDQTAANVPPVAVAGDAGFPAQPEALHLADAAHRAAARHPQRADRNRQPGRWGWRSAPC